MKNYFCFYCQQDVEPHVLLKWRFCPHCRHRITDSGDGFYRVCDHCGANMPPTAKQCVKCGYTTDGQQPALPRQLGWPVHWYDWLVAALAVLFSVIIAVGILYVSFYLLLVFFVAGLAWFLFNLLLARRL